MKINYIIWNFGCTGGNKTFVEIGNRLAKKGHKIIFTILGGSHDWAELEKNVQVIKYEGPQGFINKVFWLIRNMVDADVTVATWYLTAFPVAFFGKGKKFYHMQHYEPLFYKSAFKKLLVKLTYYLPLNRIVNSTWLKKQLKERHGKDAFLVNHGMDTGVFRIKIKIKKDKEKLVLTLGKQDVVWKGFNDAVEAMKIVNAERKDVKLVAYGVKEPKVSAEINYKFVRFPSDEQLVDLYNQADVVLCPSWYESFPLPPLEGMACGTPVITTPYGTEDYAFNGVNALVVSPRDPYKMAEAITSILNNKKLRDKLVKNGLKTVKDFTWDKTAEKVKELFVGV